MRRFVPILGTVATVLVCLGTDQVPGLAQARTADTVVAAARTALGGESKIAGVKTFIVTGRTRQVRGDNLVPIEFEIQAELPDKYSRRDEFPAQDAGPVTSGFAGDQLVLIPRPVPPPPRPGMPAPPPGAMEAQLRARLMQAKQDFARLLLGMFAGTTPAFPVTYSYAGQAEAPQGKADVIDVKGPANFFARLFIGDNGLPIMLTWTGATGATRATGATGATGAAGATGATSAAGAAPKPPAPVPPAAPAAPAAPAPAAPAPAAPAPVTPAAPVTPVAPVAPAAPVEQRLFFADYRDVDGLKLPFRIRRAAGSETTEETTFDRYRINAKVDPRRFETAAK